MATRIALNIDPYLKSWPVQVRQKRFDVPPAPDQGPLDLESLLAEPFRPAEDDRTLLKRGANNIADFLWGTTPEETVFGDLMGALMGTNLMVSGAERAVLDPVRRALLNKELTSEITKYLTDVPSQQATMLNLVKSHPRTAALFKLRGGTIRAAEPSSTRAIADYSPTLEQIRLHPEKALDAISTVDWLRAKLAADPTAITSAGVQRLPGQDRIWRHLTRIGRTEGVATPSPITHEFGHVGQGISGTGRRKIEAARTTTGRKQLTEVELGARITEANQTLRRRLSEYNKFAKGQASVPTVRVSPADRMKLAQHHALTDPGWLTYLYDLPENALVQTKSLRGGRAFTAKEIREWADTATGLGPTKTGGEVALPPDRQDLFSAVMDWFGD